MYADGGPHAFGTVGGTDLNPRQAFPDFHRTMIDREKVLSVLHKRFPGAPADQVAGAANAIVGLDDEWEDVTGHEPEFGYHFSVQCRDNCYLAEQTQLGHQFRVFRRRVTTA
jgi:hypothetical protein